MYQSLEDIIERVNINVRDRNSRSVIIEVDIFRTPTTQ